MAKNLITVASLIESFLITGLEKNEVAQAAFVQYCSSEYGALSEDNKETFASLKLSGKGDKAKGKLNRGSVEFKGGHNTALCALAAASMFYDLESSTGRLIGKADCSTIIKSWWEGKTAKSKIRPLSEPTPEPAKEVESAPVENQPA